MILHCRLGEPQSSTNALVALSLRHEIEHGPLSRRQAAKCVQCRAVARLDGPERTCSLAIFAGCRRTIILIGGLRDDVSRNHSRPLSAAFLRTGLTYSGLARTNVSWLTVGNINCVRKNKYLRPDEAACGLRCALDGSAAALALPARAVL